MKPHTLQQRCDFFNLAYPQLLPMVVVHSTGKPAGFLMGYWHVGGGNISDLYGSYQINYLEQIETLFPDCTSVVHLFVGSLPPSPKYTRVGLAEAGYNKPDIECDAHELSSKLKFRPDLIYADPPYSIEDSEHYSNAMVNRSRIIDECGTVLQPGGFLVWMDVALPVFSNKLLRQVGAITYIRSTGNRFRVVTIFQKPLR